MFWPLAHHPLAETTSDEDGRLPARHADHIATGRIDRPGCVIEDADLVLGQPDPPNVLKYRPIESRRKQRRSATSDGHARSVLPPAPYRGRGFSARRSRARGAYRRDGRLPRYFEGLLTGVQVADRRNACGPLRYMTPSRKPPGNAQHLVADRGQLLSQGMGCCGVAWSGDAIWKSPHEGPC